MNSTVARAAMIAVGTSVSLVVAGCAAGQPESTPGDTAGVVVTVFAAASLTEVFAELEEQFEDANPGVDVVVNLGGSSTLAEQIVQGAPAQVFAAANDSTMQRVVDAGLAGDPQIFASNTLQIVVPQGNPAGVAGLGDLARDELVIALCAAEVPCGAVAAATLEAAGVTPTPDTFEQDVRAVLTKVVLGEVDAGLVYTTDVIAAGARVEGVDISQGFTAERSAHIVDAATTRYPIAALTGASAAATDFVDFVRADTGVRILTEAGFGPR